MPRDLWPGGAEDALQDHAGGEARGGRHQALCASGYWQLQRCHRQALYRSWDPHLQ